MCPTDHELVQRAIKADGRLILRGEMEKEAAIHIRESLEDTVEQRMADCKQHWATLASQGLAPIDRDAKMQPFYDKLFQAEDDLEFWKNLEVIIERRK